MAACSQCAQGCASSGHLTDLTPDPWLKGLKRISLVALTSFSIYVAPMPFGGGYFAGIVVCLLCGKKIAAQYRENANRLAKGCSQNLFAELTGLQFSPYIALLIDDLIAGAHIEHHSILPVINGFVMGAWTVTWLRGG